jgi:GxxExxY protein
MDKVALEVTAQNVIDAAHRVSRELGIGFLEKVYENALAWELRKRGFEVAQQVPLTVAYDGHVVGEYFADLRVESELIVEVKVSSAIAVAHRLQCLNYLRASRLRLGLVLNFGNTRLDVSRVVYRL